MNYAFLRRQHMRRRQVVAALGGGGSGAAALLAGETQGFAVDFTDMTAVVKDTGTPANNFSGDPNDLLTYISPSTKWIRNAAGLLVSGTTLRTEYHANGNPLGIRVEDERTNLAPNSKALAAWQTSSVNATVTSDQTVAPDGELTADKLIGTAVGQCTLFRNENFIDNTNYAFSYFVKAAEASWAVVMIQNQGNIYERQWVNLSTGAKGTGNGAVEAFGNGWYRVSVANNSSSGVATERTYVQLADADNTTTFTGNGSSGAYFWGIQLEAGSFHTSYTPTAASTVTRAADVLGPALTGFPWNGGVGTYEVDGVAATPTNNGTILTLAPRSGQTHIRTVKWVPSP